jgi:hypothetical protein
MPGQSFSEVIKSHFGRRATAADLKQVAARLTSVVPIMCGEGEQPAQEGAGGHAAVRSPRRGSLAAHTKGRRHQTSRLLWTRVDADTTTCVRLHAEPSVAF